MPRGWVWLGIDRSRYMDGLDNIKTVPMTYFHRALEIIIAMHNKKAKDYTANHREFGNFEDSAKHAGITVAQTIESLIGTKEARRQNLEHSNLKPVNESIEDTLLDRAVYSLIRYAHYLKEKDETLQLQEKCAYSKDQSKPFGGSNYNP